MSEDDCCIRCGCQIDSEAILNNKYGPYLVCPSCVYEIIENWAMEAEE